MRTWIRAAVLAALALAPLDGQAQDRPQGRDVKRSGRALERILEMHEELKLSDQQMVGLREVAARQEELNQPLLEQLRGVRPETRERRSLTAEERQALRARMEELRPALQQLRENRRAAMQEVREILSPEQRQRIAQRLRAQAQARRDGVRGRRGADAHRPGGGRLDGRGR